jgi:nicotinamidase/pyrazinamidase
MISYIALIMVDIQNDFLPGGALGVPQGNKIIPVTNQYIRFFSKQNLPVFFTRDWHPEETVHFKQEGGPWPPHCIQNTKGAEFHPDLFVPDNAEILSKGMDPRYDGYSAFDARNNEGRRFPDILKDRDISTFYIGGIATDYCVRATSLDALKEGFDVYVLMDAIKGVNQEDSRKAIEEITTQGAVPVTFSEVEKSLKK